VRGRRTKQAYNTYAAQPPPRSTQGMENQAKTNTASRASCGDHLSTKSGRRDPPMTAPPAGSATGGATVASHAGPQSMMVCRSGWSEAGEPFKEARRPGPETKRAAPNHFLPGSLGPDTTRASKVRRLQELFFSVPQTPGRPTPGDISWPAACSRRRHASGPGKEGNRQRHQQLVRTGRRRGHAPAAPPCDHPG